MQRPDGVGRAHNVHNGMGQPAEATDRFLAGMRTLDADVGVVTEAKALVRHLRAQAPRHGYRVVAETPRPTRPGAPVPEEGDTVLLVRSKLVRRTATKVNDLTWIVRRYSRVHQPRRDQVALTKGLVRGYYALHLPPGGPDDRRNGTAWKDQMQAALAWAGRGGCRAVLGDVNCSKERLRAFLDHYEGPHADRVRGAHIVGHGVDLMLVVGGRGTASKGDNEGSDHPVVVYGIIARGRLAAARRWLKQRLRRLRRRPPEKVVKPV